MRQHDAPVKGVHCAMQFYYVMLVKMFVSSRGCTMQHASLFHAEAVANLCLQIRTSVNCAKIFKVKEFYI